MPPNATGEVVEYQRRDGLTTFSLRVRADAERHRIRLGTDEEGWTRARADRELTTTLALIYAGKWTPAPKAEMKDKDPTFHEFSTRWLDGRRGELRQATIDDYSWRLSSHLLPLLADRRVSTFDVEVIDSYRIAKVRERERIIAAAEQGDPIRDAQGRRVRPLANESINKTIGLLGTILDLAVEHGLLAANPARGGRRRLKAARPRRPFLEPDEVQSLLEAARQLDTPHRPASARARFVKGLRDHGLTYIDIEQRHGIPRGSAYYLYQRAIEVPEPRPEHRTTVIATLAGAGLRVGELCGLTWRDVDLTHGRLHVLDAKTPTGIREVELSPWVVEQLRGYIGSPPSATPVFVSGSGRARTEKNVCDNVVRRAVKRASATRAGAGLPELPAGITPHALRCTYISLLLEAGYPLPYVMAQVGHADESTTLQIYARVLKRRPRSGLHAALDGFLAGDDPAAPETFRV